MKTASMFQALQGNILIYVSLLNMLSHQIYVKALRVFIREELEVLKNTAGVVLRVQVALTRTGAGSIDLPNTITRILHSK